MKTSLLAVSAILLALSPMGNAKPHNGHGRSSHHYSPHSYRSHGYLGQGYGYGGGPSYRGRGYDTHQVYDRGYSGHSYYDHSGYGYSEGHHSHRGIYINLFDLLGR